MNVLEKLLIDPLPMKGANGGYIIIYNQLRRTLSTHSMWGSWPPKMPPRTICKYRTDTSAT